MNKILVGVTGKGENTAALKFAAQQAAALHESVTLVHAIHPMLAPPPPSVLLVDNDWDYIGRAVLADVEEEFRSLTHDEVPVDVIGMGGKPASVFAELSSEARLVVLQHRDLSRLYRITSGSTAASVATFAHCPVVSVPATHDDHVHHGVVTAGVHEDGGPVSVLETAFDEADRSGRALSVVHAYRLPAAYDDVLMHDARWRNETHAAITAKVDETAAKHPEVTVDVAIRHDWPADVLAELSRTSDLLVVGRHGHCRMLPARLGSMARSVLAHAECPVMVVPVG